MGDDREGINLISSTRSAVEDTCQCVSHPAVGFAARITLPLVSPQEGEKPPEHPHGIARFPLGSRRHKLLPGGDGATDTHWHCRSLQFPWEEFRCRNGWLDMLTLLAWGC